MFCQNSKANQIDINMKKLTLIALAFIISAGCASKSKFIALSSTDTATTSLFSSVHGLSIAEPLITIQPSSIVWHWGDNKMPMTWLPKPNMSNIDSVEIYVPKRLTYWLNDSTLIIKKP